MWQTLGLALMIDSNMGASEYPLTFLDTQHVIQKYIGSYLRVTLHGHPPLVQTGLPIHIYMIHQMATLVARSWYMLVVEIMVCPPPPAFQSRNVSQAMANYY